MYGLDLSSHPDAAQHGEEMVRYMVLDHIMGLASSKSFCGQRASELGVYPDIQTWTTDRYGLVIPSRPARDPVPYAQIRYGHSSSAQGLANVHRNKAVATCQLVSAGVLPAAEVPSDGVHPAE